MNCVTCIILPWYILIYTYWLNWKGSKRLPWRCFLARLLNKKSCIQIPTVLQQVSLKLSTRIYSNVTGLWLVGDYKQTGDHLKVLNNSRFPFRLMLRYANTAAQYHSTQTWCFVLAIPKVYTYVKVCMKVDLIIIQSCFSTSYAYVYFSRSFHYTRQRVFSKFYRDQIVIKFQMHCIIQAIFQTGLLWLILGKETAVDLFSCRYRTLKTSTCK